MLPPIQRLVALAEGILMIAMLCMAVVGLDKFFYAPKLGRGVFSLVLAFLTLVCLLITSEFFGGFVLSAVRGHLRKRSEAWQEKISSLLLGWLEGKVKVGMLRRPAMFRRRDFEKVLIETLGLLRGSQKDRLGELAVRFRFVARWRRSCVSPRWSSRKESLAKLALVVNEKHRVSPRGFLWDRSPRVRTEAVRGLLRAGDPKDLEQAFRTAIGLPLVGRVLIGEELRPYASALAWSVIPDVLQNGSPKEALAALSMLDAWNVAVPVEGIEHSLASEDTAVRAAAVQIAPLVLPPERAADVVEEALHPENALVAKAALRAAGRLRDTRLAQTLLRCTHAENHSIARQACAVLAALGPDGTDLLELDLRSNAPGRASRAAEGLQRAYTGSGWRNG